MRAAPIRCGVAVSVVEQTGQSEEIHSPEAWAKSVVSRIWPEGLVDGGGLNGGDLVLAQALADDI